MLGAAAWQPATRQAQAAGRPGTARILAPIGFALAGLAVLVVGSAGNLNVLAIALAAASLTAVLARLLLTHHENLRMLRISRSEALTDALTGLGNRRALALDLEDTLDPDGEGHGSAAVLALFDLDGFKHYNDSFGHPSGDALLQRLGESLAVAVAGRGRRLPHGRRRVLRAARPGGRPPRSPPARRR